MLATPNFHQKKYTRIQIFHCVRTHARINVCVRVCVCLLFWVYNDRKFQIQLSLKYHDECVFAAWCASNKNWFKAVRYVHYTKDWIQIKYVRNYDFVVVCVCVRWLLFYNCATSVHNYSLWFSSLLCQLFTIIWCDFQLINLHLFFDRSSQLPARSTRLLNRSRLHQNADSPRSIENIHLLSTKTTSQYGRDSANGSPDEQLFMLDKTLRNSMMQDVQYCKQQLLQLRSILQEVSVNRNKIDWNVFVIRKWMRKTFTKNCMQFLCLWLSVYTVMEILCFTLKFNWIVYIFWLLHGYSKIQ